MNRPIKRLAIANRGEVAVRIIRACQELDIETVLLHSEPDVNTLAYRLSDHQICIGPAPANESYLRIQDNIRGALAMGAKAIHPGFGFLSENAEFARACQKENLVFIGPTPENIQTCGDKIKVKYLAKELGIKTIPGYNGEDQTIDLLVAECKAIGFPVLVKAAAGGGGRGHKVIHDAASAKEMIEASQREAKAAFGSSKVFLEKYLGRAKHIEVQVFGDAIGKIYSLCERECSVQRKHQKIIEEGPSAKLNPEEKKKVHEMARKLAERANYKNAGTVEFLYQDGEFYLIEMNTRLQVEHPVTEMILSIDLVKSQILTAQGTPLSWNQENLVPRGHSIECRIYAEDPNMGGLPNTGVLKYLEFPEGPGRRFDLGFEAGDEVTPFYDSMINKIIVWDESRPAAIRKMLRVLDDTIVFGLKTNIPFLKAILNHHEFISGEMTTQFIEKNFPNALGPMKLTPEQTAFAEQAYSQAGAHNPNPETSRLQSPWEVLWRNV
ncbi:MAG: pyruvate carboxylase subunit A [Proteobacteria bacterium SG_bin7]|nr:MAG: pyruvate carboxylase subunit A [Proteobacteria bacterium SG_bin7]